MKRVRVQAEEAAEDRVLDALVPPPRDAMGQPVRDETGARQVFRKRLREGQIDHLEVEIELPPNLPTMEIMAPPGMEEMSEQIRQMFAGLSAGRGKARKVTVREAMRRLTDEEASRRLNEEELRAQAVANVEQNGIVFLDEIDKIASRQEAHGADVSRQGVQRDLLPLVEGTTVSTKYGMIRTDHILFIASGAFHLSKPSDLIPELQGRFPIRVELEALQVDDFVHILQSTDASLTRQMTALLATEGLDLQFTPEGVRRLAEVAWQANEQMENIGARRLHTVMEKLLEEVSFEAARLSGQTVVIDAAYVDERLAGLLRQEDLARYVL
jgi:ATP-dependent HslUV protease ATP-binding subunit HslU